MRFENHGGGCCGRRHIFGMNGETADSIRRIMVHNGLNADSNKITEIVLSEENEDLEDLQTEVVNAGFVLVARWENCSGSTCYMYLHANDWLAFPNGAEVAVVPPQVLVQAPPPPPAPRPAAPVVVARLYHNVLRSGRSEAGWPTLEAARAAAPRCRRIDCQEILDTGAILWQADIG